MACHQIATTVAFLGLDDPHRRETTSDPEPLWQVAARVQFLYVAVQEEESEQARLLRDIVGNPFRRVTLDPAWRTSTVVALAGQMYASRDFNAMPILADALMDAGCDSDDILSHLRGPGLHARGCWALDLVLGKQ